MVGRAGIYGRDVLSGVRWAKQQRGDKQGLTTMADIPEGLIYILDKGNIRKAKSVQDEFSKDANNRVDLLR